MQLIERDVEAPEVFRAQDRALWDGRPSLGGVWVAAPSVPEPERVIIRNEENGKFVIGALFNRERDNPGPPLQLSSEAAIALGIIAGSPTSIDVVALRREEVDESVSELDGTAASDEVETDLFEEEIVQAEPLDTPDLIETAAAALDAPLDPAQPGTDRELAIETLPDAEIAADPAPRRNLFQRLFRRNQTPETEVISVPPVPDVEDAISAIPTATTTTPVAIESTSLDAPSVQTAAPLDTQVASATPPPPRATTLDRAYVQIGIFSVEENARNTATALANAGVLPTVLEEQSRGKTFWRVIVGPSTTTSDRAAILRKARDLGFADAYAVRG
ncbi:MAG: SPOR domain-containing protein [Pseudomonadota bacterium]